VLALIIFLILDLPRINIILDKFQGGALRFERLTGTLEYGYPGYFIFETLFQKPRINLSEQELAEIDAYLKIKSSCSSSYEYEETDAVSHKNMLLILVESLETFPLHRVLGGHEITPFLNSLCRDSSVLYIPHITTEVAGGRSSDAQLLYNTGLLPIKHGAACYLNGIKYESLANVLKKERNFKDCVTIHAFSPTIWNQRLFAEMLGYDKVYNGCDFDDSDKIGNPISDASLVNQSVPIIVSLQQPFFVQFITASSHDPIDIGQKKSFDLSKWADTSTAHYLEIINYVDKAIQSMFDSLSDNHLLGNTVVIITGDHSSGYEEDFKDKYFVDIRGEQHFIPFIVYGLKKPYRHDDVISQVNIYPTLLDVLGLKTNWRGISNSIFESKCCENTDKQFDIHQLSDWMIRGNYFKSNNFQTEKNFK
jgi:phosphoglycerol transferase MdoB-like AlkP superfamily enzyme